MPRAGLSRDRVVDEASLIADEVGLEQLTLAALADRLGVKQPSLYKHIDSLGGLHRDIGLRARRELAELLSRAAVGRSGADAIVSMAHAYRAWAREHPGRYAASQRAPKAGDVDDEAAAFAAVQVIADALIGYGLEGDDAIDAIRALRATLHGFVSLEMEGAFALSADIDTSFRRLVTGFTLSLQNWAATGDATA